MRFNQTKLYGLLKRSSYVGDLVADRLDRRSPHILGVAGDAAAAGRGARDFTVNTTTNFVGRATDVAEDAGSRFGGVLGDMFGKLNDDPDDYEDRDIVKLKNQQEAIALLNREAKRLECLARIQARRKKRLAEMTRKSVNSPFI